MHLPYSAYLIIKPPSCERVELNFNIFTYIVCFITTGLLTWRGGLQVWDYLFKTRGHQSDLLRLVYWPFMLLETIGIAFFCVVFIIRTIKALRGVDSYGTD